ncbi:hypothetical protein I5V61_12405 [Stenotrophomonas maltophilia]|uniref:hypothetical protein n=1 Tax=Stenotrophomonas geniculata TaxID=86188 RepID=UPI0018D47461|nr:hypothetical protein [Stenotrophomonas maltophilia]
MWKWLIGLCSVMVAVTLAWVCLWLWTNTVFANPALLEAKDALGVQAAWAQALLSVFAVLVAIGVAWHQAQQSRALIESERTRLRDIEKQESADRQTLVASCLKDTLDGLVVLSDQIKANDSVGTEKSIARISALAHSALNALRRVFPVLSATPNGALLSYRIEVELEKLSKLRSHLSEHLYSPDVFGDSSIKSSFLHKDIVSAVALINRSYQMLYISIRGL